jgi:hypothetical protein
MFEEWSDDPQDAHLIGCDCMRTEGGGLALLSHRYAQQLSVNEDRFEWSRITLEKWGAGGINGLTCFQAWHVLALYHRLDPDSLGLTGPRGNFEFLRHQVKDDPSHVVTQFAQQLDQLKDDIRAGRLLVHQSKWSRPEASETWVAAFLTYIKGRPLITRKTQAPDIGAVIDAGKPPPWHCDRSTPQMWELSELSGLFTTPLQGGSYVPGDPQTMPDIYSAARARGIPHRRAEQYQVILCGLQPGGRPKKCMK